MAAVALGGSLVGRQLINDRIEKKLPVEIEAARTQATIELDKEINQVISEKLLSFTVNLVIKSGLVGLVYLGYSFGVLSATGFTIAIGILIALFIGRDLFTTIPFIVPAYRQIRSHQWRFRTAIVEFVAGVAFERAYAQAMIAMETGHDRFWLAFSKYSAHSISEEVGEAVADVARTISVKRAEGRAAIAIALALLMSGAYFGFFWLTVHAV